ncbi:MAG: hypothetical protein JWQ19_3968 [Subtercola sp.]|nr:hypothetical protein [Subtercola sp.]
MQIVDEVEEFSAVAQAAIALSRELEEDYVEVWKIAWHLRRLLPQVPPQVLHQLGLGVLNGLVASGAALGDLSRETGGFVPWDSSEQLAEAARRWTELDREPNMGDIGWLART